MTVDDFFGVPWDQLDVHALRTFLANAGSESLRWEAKADNERGALDRRDIAKAICAFANSELGGYLILGAKQDGRGGPWVLPGLAMPPSGDLPPWVSQIAAGMRPRPTIDVRELGAERDRGPTAVVWIPPAGEPPVITQDGTVYLRVAGASIPVTDQHVLAELFASGKAARARAESAASSDKNLQPGPSSYGGFIFAATGGPRGLDAPLFRSRVFDAMEASLRDAFKTWVGPAPLAKRRVQPETLRVRIPSLGSAPSAQIVATRTGVVAIQVDANPGASGNALAIVADSDWPAAAWRASLPVHQALGSSGSLFVRLEIARDFASIPWQMKHVTIELWAALAEPSDEHVALLTKEVRRAAGEPVLDDDS